MKKLKFDEFVREAAKDMIAPDHLYDRVQTSFIRLEEIVDIAFDQAFTYGYVFVLQRLRVSPYKDAHGELIGLHFSLDDQDDVYANIKIDKLGQDKALPWRFGIDDKEIKFEDLEDERHSGENRGTTKG